MKRICPGGWLPTLARHDPPRVLGEAAGPPEDLTHGLCPDCQVAVDAYMARRKAAGPPAGRARTNLARPKRRPCPCRKAKAAWKRGRRNT